MSDFAAVPIQSVQEYWNRRPCNIRHSNLEVGTREYFDQVEARKYFVEPHIPAFAEFDRWRGKRVLEIGCGIGTDTMNFARAGAHVTAVDLSSKSIEVAQQRAEVFGLADRISFHQANAERLSDTIPAQKFDLVYSFGVIHHSPSPDAIIKEIKRNFVAPGSTLKLMVYNRYSWKVFWILTAYGKGAFWKLDQLIAEHSEAQTGCPITYAYTRAGLARAVADGFDVADMFVDHVFPYRIPDYVKYEYVREWYFRYLPRSVFRAFEKKLGWHLCVTAVAR